MLPDFDEPVVVVPYDPSWPARFEALREALVIGLPGLFVAVEHFGSTSVPGLAAKPVIDVIAAAASTPPAAKSPVFVWHTLPDHRGGLRACRHRVVGGDEHKLTYVMACSGEEPLKQLERTMLVQRGAAVGKAMTTVLGAAAIIEPTLFFPSNPLDDHPVRPPADEPHAA